MLPQAQPRWLLRALTESPIAVSVDPQQESRLRRVRNEGVADQGLRWQCLPVPQYRVSGECDRLAPPEPQSESTLYRTEALQSPAARHRDHDTGPACRL